MSEMQTEVNKGLLKFAIGQTLFCPRCNHIMDVTNAVQFDLKKNGEPLTTGIRCGTCYDKLAAACIAKASTTPGLTLTAEVIDGRQLYPKAAPAKAQAPVEKAAFNVKTVQTGHTYAIHHSSGYIVPATVLRLTGHDVRDYGWYATRSVVRTNTHYVCCNERTGREIIVKSAAKFRYEMERNAAGQWERKRNTA